MQVDDIFVRFMEDCADDPMIGPSHISLFAAILQVYIVRGRQLPIVAFSRDIKRLAKLSDRTYYTCLKYLSSSGYITYHVSYDPAKGSQIGFVQHPKR